MRSAWRAHGVPHPLPDAKGDFSLTPAEEQRLQSVPRKTRKAAETACFHYLKALNLKPLSPWALARATAVVAELGRCIRSHGLTVGKPEVKNLSRGRAFFGFKTPPRPAYGSAQQKLLVTVQHACEKQVDMAARISKIIDQDPKQRPRPPLTPQHRRARHHLSNGHTLARCHSRTLAQSVGRTPDSSIGHRPC